MRVATWNVQGSDGVDVDGVAEIVRAADLDVLVLQEIGWLQARRVARRLGMQRCWAFKHLAWPHAEGLAVLTPHRLVAAKSFVLRRELWWNWRRRIAIRAVIDGASERFNIINVHLSPHDHGDNRRREVARVVDAAHRMTHPPIIAGDFNDAPDGPGPADLEAAGWVDAWKLERLVGIDGSTNWTAGDRRGRPPTQRLDYVFVPAGWTVLDAAVLAPAERFDWFAERSDHLPLSAVIQRSRGDE